MKHLKDEVDRSGKRKKKRSQRQSPSIKEVMKIPSFLSHVPVGYVHNLFQEVLEDFKKDTITTILTN